MCRSPQGVWIRAAEGQKQANVRVVSGFGKVCKYGGGYGIYSLLVGAEMVIWAVVVI